VRSVRHYPRFWIQRSSSERWRGSNPLIWTLPSAHYARVRLLWIVHQRLRLLTFSLRTIGHNSTSADPEISLYRSHAAWPVRIIDCSGGPTRWELPEISCASST
jgi:hypothetical protein